jgi:hypothetical protein
LNVPRLRPGFDNKRLDKRFSGSGTMRLGLLDCSLGFTDRHVLCIGDHTSKHEASNFALRYGVAYYLPVSEQRKTGALAPATPAGG